MPFHGTLDSNIAIEQSRHVAKSLEAARVPHELVTFDYLGNAPVLLSH
jgi:dipeptidyl aminopeptidase/acylaminoacyl peptidase